MATTREHKKASIKVAVKKAVKRQSIRDEKKNSPFVNIKDPATGHN